VSGAGEQSRGARAELAQRLATLDQLNAEASGRVYGGESVDRSVVAKVDGNGELLTLRIHPPALRVAHPERVGYAVVAAVTSARERAAGAKAQQVRAAFGRPADT
jgi:DNA-binding protein YbaB